jgi:hypothetical protein
MMAVLETVESVERGNAITFCHGGIIEDVVDEVFHAAVVG